LPLGGALVGQVLVDGRRADADASAMRRIDSADGPSSLEQVGATANDLARAGAARLRSAGSHRASAGRSRPPGRARHERPGQRRDEVAGSDARQRGEAEQDRSQTACSALTAAPPAVELTALEAAAAPNRSATSAEPNAKICQ